MTVIPRRHINRYKNLIRLKARLESVKDFYNQELNKVRNNKSTYENILDQVSAQVLAVSNAKSALYLEMSSIIYIPSDGSSLDATVRKAARAAWLQIRVLKARIKQKDTQLIRLNDQQNLALKVVQKLGANEDTILSLRNRVALRILTIEVEIQSYYTA